MVGTYSLLIFKFSISLFIPISLEVGGGRRKLCWKLSNEKIHQSAALPAFVSFGKANSRSPNKTSCSSRIYTICIRVRGSRKKCLPTSQAISNLIDLSSKRLRTGAPFKIQDKNFKKSKTQSEVCPHLGLSNSAMHSRVDLIWPVSPFNLADLTVFR